MKKYLSQKREHFNNSVKYAGNVVWEGLGNALASPVTNIKMEPNYDDMDYDQLSELSINMYRRGHTFGRISEGFGVGCIGVTSFSGLMAVVFAGITALTSPPENHKNISQVVDNLQSEQTRITEQFDGYIPQYAQTMLKDISAKINEAKLDKTDIESSKEYVQHKQSIKRDYSIAGGFAVLAVLSFLSMCGVMEYEWKAREKRRELRPDIQDLAKKKDEIK